MVKKQDKVKLLEAALKAAEDVIGWYESDAERSCHEEEEVPEELRELEEVLEAAKAKLK